MLLTAIILIIVLGAVFDFVRVLLLYALVWLAPIAAAMAALQIALALHPDEPSIIFGVVMIVAVVTRVLLELLAMAARKAS